MLQGAISPTYPLNPEHDFSLALKQNTPNPERVCIEIWASTTKQPRPRIPGPHFEHVRKCMKLPGLRHAQGEALGWGGENRKKGEQGWKPCVQLLQSNLCLYVAFMGTIDAMAKRRESAEE